MHAYILVTIIGCPLQARQQLDLGFEFGKTNKLDTVGAS